MAISGTLCTTKNSSQPLVAPNMLRQAPCTSDMVALVQFQEKAFKQTGHFLDVEGATVADMTKCARLDNTSSQFISVMAKAEFPAR